MEQQSTVLQPLTFTVHLELPDSELAFAARRGESVLAGARRHGIVLPSRCEQGWCTTCAARVLSGELDHSAAARYYESDREAGFALICAASARSPLRLRTHAAAELRDHRRRCGLPAPRG
jgi:ferredoxin